MKFVPFVLLAAAAVFFSAQTSTYAQSTVFTAYVVASGAKGDQNLSCCPQTLGMDFNVNQSINVVSLGVFDSGGDGLAGSTAAHIFDRDTQKVVATLQFSHADPGILVGGSRFKLLALPLTLAAGFHGSIVVDYLSSPVEPNGNRGNNRPNAPWSTDTGGGLISFVGGGRIGRSGNPNDFPTEPDGGPADRYAAGTFQYTPVPEPAAVALLALGCLGIAPVFTRRTR